MNNDKLDKEPNPDPEEAWESGRLLLGDFEVQRVLGQGGMGKVYLVRSRTTGMEFAVKRALTKDDNNRQNFLSELQTWIDLPEQDNLVTCRFFRTVSDEVLIFAEYVEGGSLKQWIDTKKLYKGGARAALERMLDVAIQFAWGLQCVHELGLVHQDVKPANVLMTSDGIAKIADFGLARARAPRQKWHFWKQRQSLSVVGAGYTPAYCSPEQSDGRKLDKSTDVWSWGLSILEMFQGEVTWHSGRVAPSALEVFLERNGEEKSIPAMPSQLAEILGGCFQQKPAQRYTHLNDVVQKMKDVYSTVIGADYSRTLDQPEPKIGAQISNSSRRTTQGYSWTDPRIWLERALRAEGYTSTEVAKTVAARAASRRGQMAADIAVFDEARGIYERLLRQGRADLEYDLSVLCLNAALVHEKSDDFPGALALCNRAIEIHEDLKTNGETGSAATLAMLYEQKANVVAHSGDNAAALALYERAILLYERLIKVRGGQDLDGGLATAYGGKAVALMNLGNARGSLTFYDKAAAIIERLVSSGGAKDFANTLATLYMNRATAFVGVGDLLAALSLYDRAILIRERLVREGDSTLLHSLAVLYMNKAIAIRHCGDGAVAVPVYEKAIEILDKLVNVDGRRELANELASLYMNTGIAFFDIGNKQAATELYDRAIAIREQLVNSEGRVDLAVSLARVYMNKANAVVAIPDPMAAMQLYDRAIEILSRVHERRRSPELVSVLVHLYLNKGYVMAEIMGDYVGAIGVYDLAFRICEPSAEDQPNLTDLLVRLHNAKGIALMKTMRHGAAVEAFDRAVGIVERQIAIDHRHDLTAALASIKKWREVALAESRSVLKAEL